jgi:spore coat protein A
VDTPFLSYFWSSSLPSSRRSFLEQAAALGLLYQARQLLSQAMPGMHMPDKPQASGPSQATPVVGTANPAKPRLHTLQLAPFVDALPLPPLARPVMHSGRHSVTVTMREVRTKVHRDVPPTRMWSYGPDALAPLIEARSGQPLEIHWVNNLPQKHFLPIDYSLHGSGRDVPDVRTVAHLHGAKVQSKYDGYPVDWFRVGESRSCIYPFQQEAATLWVHDHAMGINRLNTYAGLVGMLLVRDQTEDALRLPDGKYEVPLILYDRDFTDDGQLFYDVSGDEKSPWISEFSADGLLVNGKIRPYFEVEPRLYRFRILNTANSRFYILSLTENHSFHQVGSDQGLLASSVEMKRLILAPAERADVLVDFSGAAGKNVHLRNGGLEMVQFRVAERALATERNTIPHILRPIARTPESEAVKTRTITLHDYKDKFGGSMVMLLNRKHWHEPTTEFPKLNTTEIWEFVNLTEDTHPMHVHMVRFQILDRRTFDTSDYAFERKLRFTGEAVPPPPHELGWKDVVQCPPGTITRVIMKFEGFTGKYLYHCHILEHEANDMMRPFEVVA